MQGLHPKAGGPHYDKIYQDASYLKREYPYMEYFLSCRILKRDVNEIRPLELDKSIDPTIPEIDSNSDSSSETNKLTSNFSIVLTIAHGVEDKRPYEKGDVIIEVCT